jgi:hypothetical protein
MEDDDLWTLGPGTTSDLLLQRFFAAHSELAFRVVLAANPALEPEVELVLAQDHKVVQLALVENRVLERRTQCVLAESEHLDVRMALAESDVLDPSAQKTLAIDSHSWVRYNLASNTCLAQDVLHELVKDDDLWAMLAGNDGVVLNEDLPVRFLEASSRGQELVEEELRACGADPEDAAVLRDGWGGTLAELVTTAAELGRA